MPCSCPLWPMPMHTYPQMCEGEHLAACSSIHWVPESSKGMVGSIPTSSCFTCVLKIGATYTYMFGCIALIHSMWPCTHTTHAPVVYGVAHYNRASHKCTCTETSCLEPFGRITSQTNILGIVKVNETSSWPSTGYAFLIVAHPHGDRAK